MCSEDSFSRAKNGDSKVSIVYEPVVNVGGDLFQLPSYTLIPTIHQLHPPVSSPNVHALHYLLIQKLSLRFIDSFFQLLLRKFISHQFMHAFIQS